jgi:hypothetical protein
VRGVATPQLARGADERRREPRHRSSEDRWPGETPYSAADLEDLADRLADIERRLARIEAELGALR